MGRESREAWARRVQRWDQSELTAERFARQEGVNPRTLAFWRWKLRKLRRETPRRAGRVAGVRRVATPLEFVELMTSLPSPAAGDAATSLELVLPAGYRVRLAAGFERGPLTQLLDVLEARR